MGKCVCYTLQSMGCTNHIFPIHATRNVQMHLSTVEPPNVDTFGSPDFKGVVTFGQTKVS